MKKWIAIFAIMVITAATTFFVVKSVVHKNIAIKAYTTFEDKDFLILLFPIKETDSCKRAVIVNLEEYHNDTIEVYKDNVAVAIDKKQFTAVPSANEYTKYVKRLNEELSLWGKETDWDSVEYNFSSVEEKARVVLTVKDKAGIVQEYIYLSSENSLAPASIVTIVDISKKMAN